MLDTLKSNQMEFNSNLTYQASVTRSRIENIKWVYRASITSATLHSHYSKSSEFPNAVRRNGRRQCDPGLMLEMSRTAASLPINVVDKKKEITRLH